MRMMFSEEDVFNIKRFIAVAKFLGFEIRSTGGNDRPYDFDGTRDDFLTVNEMAKRGEELCLN